MPSLPQSAPAFETERLVVRDWRPADASRMFDMYARPEANTASQAVCRRLGLDLRGRSEAYYGRQLLVWVSR